LPWPYTLPAGETIAQSVTLTFAPSIARLKPQPADPVATVAVGDRAGLAMPEIGLGAEPADLAAAIAAADELRPAGIQNLALRIVADTPDLPGVLRQGAQAAAALGAAPVLEIVLPGRNAPEVELDLVAIAAASAGFRPHAVVVSPSVDLKSYPPSVDRPAGPSLAAVYAAARGAFPGLPLGGGMFSHFTELNRRRPPVHLLDFVQHATASIVHAADDRSVMETIESLPHIFRSARGFIGDRPYRVGPANIGMAFNPYGAATTPNPDRRRLAMATEDPRQGALFGAAWALGYLIRAAQGGIAGVTIMAPTGPFGILDAKARPRPAFRVLQGLAGLAGAAVYQTASSDPQRLLALCAERAGRRSLWIVNLTPERRKIALAGFQASALTVMDEATGATLAARPLPRPPTLELGAYAVARLN
jgi:hypothetical protein